MFQVWFYTWWFCICSWVCLCRSSLYGPVHISGRRPFWLQITHRGSTRVRTRVLTHNYINHIEVMFRLSGINVCMQMMIITYCFKLDLYHNEKDDHNIHVKLIFILHVASCNCVWTSSHSYEYINFEYIL